MNQTADNLKDRIVYVYRCPKCNNFQTTECRNDGLSCRCGETMVMSTPEYTIKHYKKTRIGWNILTIFFTIVLPIISLCLFMFVKEDAGDKSTFGYKFPILCIILIAAIILKGKPLLDRSIERCSNLFIRSALVFISKNVLYIVVIAVCGVILAFIQKIGPSLQNIIIALSVVIVENTLGYCIFDYEYNKANFLIKRAIDQSSTIQAMEMSGR